MERRKEYGGYRRDEHRGAETTNKARGAIVARFL